MLLAIDIGNTKIKAAVFEGSGMVARYIFEKNEASLNIEHILRSHPELSQTIVSSVGKDDNELLFMVRERTGLMLISHESDFPFTNKYSTPATLGIDRMVLAAGAVLEYPGKNRLVIDAGTCITYDFVDSGDNYLGGAISPGVKMRYDAMHTFTAKLPLLYPEMPQHYIGDSTKNAMDSGTVNGTVYEIDGFIERYLEQYHEVTIILTGGDADFLAKRLKNTIFANSNFLLESLNHLYQYTIKQ
jgi:type III pantothenate kinase